MLSTHLLNIGNLSPDELCHYIETRYYAQTDALLKNIDSVLPKVEGSMLHEPSLIPVVAMLYSRLADEARQLMRFDRQIIFPLVFSANTLQHHLNFPASAIHKQHERILKLIARLRFQLNDYMSKSSWSNPLKMFCDDLYSMEQCLQQAIYLKENLLIPKMIETCIHQGQELPCRINQNKQSGK